LVGESPPPSGKTYFYLPQRASTATPIRQDRTLPASIFNHYFGKRPESEEEYIAFLIALKKYGIFLIDICDEPVRVRNNPEGVDRIVYELSNLRAKMKKRHISVPDDQIIFLLARNNYLREIRTQFPAARHIRWIDFRMSAELLDCVSEDMTYEP
jgi:hypothetical protein